MTYLHHGVTYNQLEDLIDAAVGREDITDGGIDYLSVLVDIAEEKYGTGSKIHNRLGWYLDVIYFDRSAVDYWDEAMDFANEHSVWYGGHPS